MTVEELEKQLKSFQSDFESTKKDFALKLESATKDAEQWKSIAAQKEADLKKFQADAEKAQAEAKKTFAESRAKENRLFLDGLKKEGKISPATETLAIKLMESMTQDAVIATFEQKDGKKVEHTQMSLFKEMLSGLAKSPIFREMSRQANARQSVPGEGEEKEAFADIKSAGSTKRLPLEGMETHLKALEYIEEQRKIGKTVSYEEALIQAEKLISQGA